MTRARREEPADVVDDDDDDDVTGGAVRDGQNANAAGRGAFSVPARARSRPVSSRRSQASRSTTPSSFLRHSTARAGDGRDERASSRPPSVDASSPPSLAASSSSEGRARDRAAAGGRRRSTTEGGGESELVRRLGTTDDRTTTGNNRQDRMPPFGGAPLDPRLHDVRPRASLFEPKTTDESIARRALSLVISHGADADVIARLATVNRALRADAICAPALVFGPESALWRRGPGGTSVEEEGAGRGAKDGDTLGPAESRRLGADAVLTQIFTRHRPKRLKRLVLFPPASKTRTVPWRGREGPPSPSARADGASNASERRRRHWSSTERGWLAPRTIKVRSISHWSPYDRVRVVNAVS